MEQSFINDNTWFRYFFYFWYFNGFLGLTGSYHNAMTVQSLPDDWYEEEAAADDLEIVEVNRIGDIFGQNII